MLCKFSTTHKAGEVIIPIFGREKNEAQESEIACIRIQGEVGIYTTSMF